MSFPTTCPACEQRIRVPQLGIRILCPYCHAKVQLPEGDVPLAVQIKDEGLSEDSQSESSTYDFLETSDVDRTEPVEIVSVDTPNEFGVIDTGEASAGLAAIQTVPVSAMTKILDNKRSHPAIEPPNLFERNWFSHLFQRQRRILRGEEIASTLPFKLLAVYALAITAALAYILLTRSQHALESLPDLKPLEVGEFRKIPIDVDLPPGHEIPLGTSRRFGNLIIRPMRLTIEPIQFEHFQPGSNVPVSDETEPVLKLWLELTVESNRPFTPLDKQLLTTRKGETDTTFLCKASDRKTRHQIVLNFDNSVDSEFNLKNQNIGRPFQPGDRQECFVACRPEGFRALLAQNEPLAWRIQIRKGISPGGNGVTTLVDILIDPDEIPDQTG